ncbi:homoserine dehydrogenase [Hydrogenovibrio marinus]|uniref:Homoserine dehydrogenase n=1 Tax=Hydrogenovibrio marinus TaxID=28885 RepID=A0A066ZYP2_HYDMR|nr:homoserine dehydrogenase [Hydrogenovibrio marinus]KDN95185.1 homoserine dehydrogenase [Hydrogenovibrio marinus]BBN59660.1 homoserine dehydrogenase [Hydrogenovibrio marinus]
MKEVRLGLLGLGTVGGGTVNILQTTQTEIQRRLGGKVSVKVEQIAVRDLNRARPVDTTGIDLTTDPLAVVNNPNVDIVVELMGGTTLAKTCLEQAIQNKKHIVTANKALIAEHGNELFKTAEAQGVMIAYESAVAGGIPIIKALREGLAANQIEWLAGIINGTGNYILTEMKKPGADFSQVLKKAQELGYAEADPTFDVEGIDAAHKLTIMASIAFGIELQFDKVYTEGISKVTGDDIQFAQKLGYQIKHLGIAARADNGFSLRVHPTLVKDSVLIANVNGVMNAVMVAGNHVGQTLYYGPGAGAGPTASAVVADIIDVIRALRQPQEDRVPGLGFALDQLTSAPVVAIDDIKSAYYLRFYAKDHAGVLAKVSSIMAQSQISIELLHQEPCADNEDDATIVMITNKVQESTINQAISALESMEEIDGDIMRIRVAGFK